MSSKNELVFLFKETDKALMEQVKCLRQLRVLVKDNSALMSGMSDKEMVVIADNLLYLMANTYKIVKTIDKELLSNFKQIVEEIKNMKGKERVSDE